MKENRKTYNRLLFLWNLLILLPFSLQANSAESKCPLVKIVPERLADLNIPRSGHSAFVVNGEVTVVGGHTSGFVLTPTAEYLKDGKWQLLNTVYVHDGGFSVVLRSGKVLIAGGFKDNLGIGQSFEVEMYDPTTHSFNGFGCLDQKRASATAIELDSAKVLITGNWYADDGMEIFNGKEVFSHLKSVRQSRCLPHLFRTSDGDVLILSGIDSKGNSIDTLTIEHMKGDAFTVPLLETWHPLQYDLPLHSDDSFIGDTSKGIYAYLMPVKDKNGQVAIIEVRDTTFSLLATNCIVPMTSQWGKILYYTPVFADRQHQRGYVMGCDNTGRQYALCIDYAKTPAQLTLYHTDPLTDGLTITIPVMMEDGNLLLTGVKTVTKPNFNFSPTPQVWLLHINDESQVESAGSAANGWLWGILAAVSVVVMIVLVAIWRRRSDKPSPEATEQPSSSLPDKSDDLLMQRICDLMEQQRPYLRSDMKLSDVAEALQVSTRAISECVKQVKDCTFPQFVNGYRIEYAKQLLHDHPDMKLSTVYTKSGFANDTSFFRTFKSFTGMSPKEWIAQRQEEIQAID